MVEKYFLGSFSPQGFRSDFGKIISQKDYKTIILKGGAGTGKSSLMKAVSKHFCDKDRVLEFYCSSDPNSLDAVVLNDKKQIIVDGTAPHVFDPIFPAVKEKILNLGEFWNEKELLKNKNEIIFTTSEHKKLMERTKRYVLAMSSIFADTYSIASDAILKEKLDGFVERLTKKLALKRKKVTPTLHFRQLSALTPLGYITQTDTLKDYECFVLNDSFFAGGDLILKSLTEVFLSKGYDVVTSYTILFAEPVCEHILVPELKLGFLSSTPLTNLHIENAKIINIHRFYDKAFLSSRKSRLKLNKKACAELVTEASQTMHNALLVHNKLEEYYISAMNFTKMDSLTKEIISDIS